MAPVAPVLTPALHMVSMGAINIIFDVQGSCSKKTSKTSIKRICIGLHTTTLVDVIIIPLWIVIVPTVFVTLRAYLSNMQATTMDSRDFKLLREKVCFYSTSEIWQFPNCYKYRICSSIVRIHTKLTRNEPKAGLHLMFFMHFIFLLHIRNG